MAVHICGFYYPSFQTNKQQQQKIIFGKYSLRFNNHLMFWETLGCLSKYLLNVCWELQLLGGGGGWGLLGGRSAPAYMKRWFLCNHCLLLLQQSWILLDAVEMIPIGNEGFVHRAVLTPTDNMRSPGVRAGHSTALCCSGSAANKWDSCSVLGEKEPEIQTKARPAQSASLAHLNSPWN